MKLGILINRYNFHPEASTIHRDLTAIAEGTEHAGCDSLWVMDHFWQLAHTGAPEEPMMEAYTTLGFLAGVTSRVSLGTLVTGVLYREPALLIKAVTALDVVSNGRAYLGIGAGWNAEESLGLGFLDPLVNDRFGRLEEVLTLAHQMWKDDDTKYSGTYYHLQRPLNRPQPVSVPRPKILIGGVGEKKTLRLVAQYGDACNLVSEGDNSVLRHKIEVLKRHCADLGRDYAEIEKTAVPPTVYLNEFVSDLATSEELILDLAAAGIEHLIVDVSPNLDLSVFDKLADLVNLAHSL